jgi:hypothetical protein
LADDRRWEQFAWDASDDVVREQTAREDHRQALLPEIADVAAEISVDRGQASRRQDAVLMPVRLMRRRLAALPQGALARCKRGAAQSAEQSACAVVVPKDVTALRAQGLVALRLRALLPRLPEQVPSLRLPLAVQRVSQSFAALQPELELKELPSRLLARQPELLP